MDNTRLYDNLIATNKRTYSKTDDYNELPNKKQKLIDDNVVKHEQCVDTIQANISKIRSDVEALASINLALSHRFSGCCYN